MFKDRIELESQEALDQRYEQAIIGRQRTYNFFWELRNAFGERLFGGLVEEAFGELGKLNKESIGRRRFFRVAGPIRIPLTPIG